MHKNFAAENKASDIKMAGAQAMAEQAVAPIPDIGQGPPVAPPQGGPPPEMAAPPPQGMEAPLEEQLNNIIG